jgi:DNA-binding CsgD family transcriptional regulator
LSKNASLSEFKVALNAIRTDQIYHSSEALKISTIENSNSNILNDNFAKTFLTTPRETEVLQCMIKNMTNIEIGKSLSLSPETIKGYRKNIYRKLGVNNVLDLYKLVLSTKYFNTDSD